MNVLTGWFTKQLATPARVRMVLAGAVIVVALGAVIASTVDEPDGGVAMSLGFGLSAPFIALVFASSAFGDLIERQTLIYLWARPVSRWQLAIAATVVSAALASIFTVPLMSALVGIEGVGSVPAAALATFLGTIAYSALFVALGARIPKALVWGSMFVLIWEGTIAPAMSGLSRLSVRYYVLSIVPDLEAGSQDEVSAAVAVVVLLVMALGGVALTRWILSTREIP
jgi:ABC-2 type transport system permease protein